MLLRSLELDTDHIRIEHDCSDAMHTATTGERYSHHLAATVEQQTNCEKTDVFCVVKFQK